MSFCIVVARYNENIEWTKQFENVIIYNKGTKLDESDNYKNEILLDNVGREGHTYFKHICDNYDNLADYNIFLQGHPFDHSPVLIPMLKQFFIQYKELDIEFAFLSHAIHQSNYKREIKSHKKNENIQKTYQDIFNKFCYEEQECIFGAGAQFVVSKRLILTRPKEFYENIVKILGYCVDPDEGYHVERFHKYIFCGY